MTELLIPIRPPDGSPSLSDREHEVKLFASEVRRTIAESGKSLRDVVKELTAYRSLSSCAATLSSWQSGASTPPTTQSGLDRVLALERCLGVPAGMLAVLIPGDLVLPVARPVSRRAWRLRATPATLDQRHRQFRAVVGQLSGPQQTIPVTTTKSVVVGRGFRQTNSLVTHEVRAAHDHVDRFWFIHAPGSRVDPTVLAASRCTRGRVLDEEDVMPGPVDTTNGDYRFSAVEFLFDKVLRRGEPYEFSFSVGYAGDDAQPGAPENLFRHFQAQPCERLDLTLEFQGVTPGRLDECVWDCRDLRQLSAVERAVTNQGRYHQSIPDARPGAYGWTWSWEPAAKATAA